MKRIIKHKFFPWKIDADTEILFIGTFNPEIAKNQAESFYGRNSSQFWTLLSIVFGEQCPETIQEKNTFVKKHKIGFIDLIEEVFMEEAEAETYNDEYLDKNNPKFTNVKGQIDKLNNLNKVFFTRRSFNAIPNIKDKIKKIELYCKGKNIKFKRLPTPADYKDIDQIKRLNEWKENIL